MSKVFLIEKKFDNCEPEDRYSYEEIIGAFNTEEKAENFIKNWMPTDIQSLYSSKEDAIKALYYKYWNDRLVDENEDSYETIDEFVEHKASYITFIKFDERSFERVHKENAFLMVTIPKIVGFHDADTGYDCTYKLSIIEQEVL